VRGPKTGATPGNDAPRTVVPTGIDDDAGNR